MLSETKYRSSARIGWQAELLAMFVFGFLLATALWVGLWFFWAKPGRAVSWRETENALQAKETALQACVAARDQHIRLEGNLQAENKQLDAKLKEALVGWGRCIKSKTAPEAQEKPKPTTP